MPSWCGRVLTCIIVVVIAGWERVVATEPAVADAKAGGVERLQSPSLPGQRSTALLLALQHGQKGENHLQEWVTYAQSNSAAMELPPVWVVCLEKSKTFALVANLAPQFQTLVVEPDASWGAVLKTFALQVWYREKGMCFRISLTVECLDRSCLRTRTARFRLCGPTRTIFLTTSTLFCVDCCTRSRQMNYFCS